LIALYVILGLAALFLALLSVPVVLRVEYAGGVTLRLRWLCFTLLRVPAPEDKKPKKKKKKKEKPEKKKEDKPEEDKPKDKGPNAFQRFYTYQGIPGFIELLGRTVDALKKFRHGLWRCFYIRELRLYMVILGGGEPQELVEKYGKVCAGVYPSLGWLSAHLRSRPGHVRATIAPDFTGLAEKEIACTAEISVAPSLLLGAVILLAIRLGVKVVLKFLSGAKPPKAKKQPVGDGLRTSLTVEK